MTVRIGMTGSDRLWQDDGRRLARRAAERRRHRRRPRRPEVVEPGQPTLEAIIDRFGEGLRRPDGSLDRAALGRLVFADPAALARAGGHRPSGGPAADPGRDEACGQGPGDGGRRRGDQARRRRPRRAVRRGLARHLRPDRPARAGDATGHVGVRGRPPDREPGRHDRATRIGRHAGSSTRATRPPPRRSASSRRSTMRWPSRTGADGRTPVRFGRRPW